MLPQEMLPRRRRRRGRMRVRRPAMPGWSLNRLVPNILTLLALCAGMTAIRYAIAERFESAVVAIIVAGILDGIDGRIARLLKGMTGFGAQLDSLSDFVDFGVAPAVLLYLWTMQAMPSVGWVLVLLYAVCCGLRLARFNTQIGVELPSYAHNFFTGVPAPAAAGLVLMPMMADFATGSDIFRHPIFNGVVLAAVAVLMVSRVPTYSLKRFHAPKEWVLPMLLAIGAAAAFLTTEFWPTLLVVGLVYLVSMPVGIWRYARLRRAAAPQGEAAAAAAGASPNSPASNS